MDVKTLLSEEQVTRQTKTILTIYIRICIRLRGVSV